MERNFCLIVDPDPSFSNGFYHSYEEGRIQNNSNSFIRFQIVFFWKNLFANYFERKNGTKTVDEMYMHKKNRIVHPYTYIDLTISSHLSFLKT